jgi:hypothetical protein
MDIKILDNNYNVIKVLDTFDSLIWNTRYNDVGDFQLKCDKKQFKYMKEGYKILNMEDDEYLGNIEGLEVRTDERTKKNTLTVTGRFEESILYRRVVMKGVYSQSIEPAEFVNLLIDRNAINPEEPERVINNLVVGTKPFSIYGPIAYESVYSNLLDTIIRVMKAAEMGFKMDINIDTGARVFNMYNGLDRTQGQTSNVPVVLSKNFDNILTSEYEKYTKDYKNVVYIKGEGEFKTSLSKGAFTGVERREMFVDLTSISRTMNDGTVLNDTQYAEVLQNEARDYLERAIKEELLYNSLNLQSNYKYKEDFDLGDLVTCAEADLDFSIDLRIVEINQVWDKKNGYSIYLNLGETKTNLSNYVENKMAGKLLPDTKKDINEIIDGTQVVGVANTANSATNADTVDGKHASDLLGINEPSVGIDGDDTRNNNYPPSEYMSSGTRYLGRAGVQSEFKNCTTIGVSSIITGTYCFLMTYNPWSDGSGGYPVQQAMGEDGRMAMRVGISDTTWGSWQKYYKSGDSVSQADNADTVDGYHAGDLFRDNANNYTTGYIHAEKGIAGAVDSYGGMLVCPGGGAYTSRSSSVSGAIKITLPIGWSSDMIRFTVKVYEYSTGESFDVVVGGYTYGSNNSWYNTFAYILSDPNKDRDFTVRFGVDGGNPCIWIGETGYSWAYPQVYVTDFQGGFTTNVLDYTQGWNISFDTTFGTIQRTHTKNQLGKQVLGNDIYHQGNITSGTANPSGGSSGDIYLQYE